MEKVFNIKELLPEFIHFYEKARQSMEILDRYISGRGGSGGEGLSNGSN